MSRLLRAISFCVLIVIMFCFSGPAWAVGSKQLAKDAKKYDGKVVTFTGEVIGDTMERKDGVWLNINDDPYSRQGRVRHLAGFNHGQGVLVPKKLVGKITTGRYGFRGDIVRVRGVFHANSPKQGGDMMINATSIRIIKSGFALPLPISARKISLAFFWLLAAMIVLILWTWRQRRAKH
ncbi:MAG: hypothetical protein KAX16_02520 [Actinomycetia bacterium]|nr:hypothetical protein [Actinomycetes bacterium]